ncbi:ABC transporter substrate-binding protein [Candidimonas humi]|uniref:ABC transporter substrate-binding protein n=1 Tax=Candidimonas humi TaxID=683355 RepID=A0ABV8NXM0_9BURK|nr:ABC transporter substrate-binding protein [Candidimonas humi]MBV6306385.1 ABC transporter substrate-binding protein [Candidimonas humi]
MKRCLAALSLFTLVLAGAAHAQTLTVYSSVDEANAKKILNAFTKDTGIKANMVFLSTGPALSRIQAESKRPQADVWFGAPVENHVVAEQRNLLEPYVSAKAAGVAPQYKDAKGYWYAIYTNPLAFGVRTDILAKRGAPVPHSWADLTKSVYKGLIQMPSPQTSGTSYEAMLTLIKLMGEDQAFAYMKALNANVQTYTQSGTAPSANLGLGQCAVAIQFTPGFLQLKDQGYKVDVVFPTEGVGHEVAAVSIIKGAKDLSAAKALIDWITSQQGQQAMVDAKTYFMPVRDDVKAGSGVPSMSQIKLVESDSEYAAKNRKRLVDRWLQDVLGQ